MAYSPSVYSKHRIEMESNWPEGHHYLVVSRESAQGWEWGSGDDDDIFFLYFVRRDGVRFTICLGILLIEVLWVLHS